MHKTAFIQELERRLREFGCPDELLVRNVQELSEHHEDLRLAAIATGATDAEAEASADSQLGQPRELALQLVEAARQSHWCGRHPILSFCLLPPLAILAALAGGLLLGWSVSNAYLPESERAALAGGGLYFKSIAHGVTGFYYLVLVAIAAIFSTLARKSGYGIKWIFGVCAICSIHGYFGRPILSPHQLSFGFGYGYSQNWIAMLLPMLVAGAAFLNHRRTKLLLKTAGSRLVMTVVLIGAIGTLSTGCKTDHKERHRGWIGGQYKVARNGWLNGNSSDVPALPLQVAKAQKAAILVTRVGTNAPAWAAGLAEGDLVLEVNHKPVTSLHQFHRLVDAAVPGTTLPMSVYRNGERTELSVRVGRETYRQWHDLTLGLFISSPDLWPNPGFSLIVLGYRNEPASRQELDSTENRYLRMCDPNAKPSDSGWNTWLGIVSVGAHKTVLGQEQVLE